MKYTGKKLQDPVTIRRPGKPVERIAPYLPGAGLVKAVNLAILLKRPLLLMGQPGCGKSKLAQAVAYELFHKENEETIEQDYKDFYLEWHIKSTSKAKDGFYEYDAIQRLGDAQVAGRRSRLAKNRYIYDRPMGLAFKKSVSEERRAVLLIDEIDKADIDFPNDLLNELDRAEFTIPETGETISAPVRPIVFITSNAEKDLPDAFLRRCLFHYIDPLDPKTLKEIIRRKFYDKEPKADEELIKKAVQQFIDIREELKKVLGEKNVSTSELLDWFEALKYYQKNVQDKKGSTKAEIEALEKELEKLGQGVKAIPFGQVLFKNWNSLTHFNRLEETETPPPAGEQEEEQ